VTITQLANTELGATITRVGVQIGKQDAADIQGAPP
jgi:hypothetical protein